MDEEAGSVSVPDSAEQVAAERVYELEFVLTVEDLAQFGEHLATVGEFHLAQMQRVRRMILAAIAVAAALLALLERDVASTIIFSIPLVIVATVLWFAWPSRYRTLARKQALELARSETGTQLGARRYRVDGQGVSFSTPQSGGYVLWPAVTRITSDDSAVYLHVAQTSAHIIPRRAFDTLAEAADFQHKAEAWRHTAAA